jgi:hypothetical protein
MPSRINIAILLSHINTFQNPRISAFTKGEKIRDFPCCLHLYYPRAITAQQKVTTRALGLLLCVFNLCLNK